MRNKTVNTSEVEKLFMGKALFHKERAKLPFEKKIEVLVKLQQLASEIKSTGAKKAGKVWGI
ncbi:MAG: hypothetical protein HZA78_04190 [Candidatus Schekmanbacteria bacterium]|nr:hypothetical protein [Candidatus Schekmanbacteria bacterium]